MARAAFKPDSSFFQKIVIGAVGTRAICNDLAQYGHKIVELERGSMDTKLWKDVKRKRVRIPDLVCTNCGARIESRAKTKAELVMSHSPTEAARAWDFGMISEDWVAFPIFEVANEEEWSAGQLNSESSYWHERNWVQWKQKGCINYFRVDGLRKENEDIVAGCAEALRQQQPLPDEVITQLLEELRSEQPSRWVVWLFGHLPREHVASSIAELQDSAPNLHYAISLLWSFVESWISHRW